MAVTFGGTTLADSDADGFDGAEGIEVGSRPLSQTTPLIESGAPVMIYRGNVTFTVSFSSRKRHADAAAAKLFCGTHAAAVSSAAANFAGFGLSLENAFCEVHTQVIGITTRSSYTITGAHNPG